MCYSAEASRNIFILNLISSIILFNYKSRSNTNKIIALCFAFVGTMQLLDWILWTHQNIKDKNEALVNYVTTKVAMIVNHMIPIVCAFIIYFYKGKLGLYSQFILFIYIILIIMYSINVYYVISYTLTKEYSLYWEWNYIYNLSSITVYTVFLFSLVILSYENIDYPTNIILAFIAIVSFILAGYYWKSIAIGRFWCKFSAFIPLIFYVLAFLKIIKL